MFYPEIWNDFIQQKHCLGTAQRDYPEWHKNRERYYVWAIDIDAGVVSQRLQHYQQLLKPLLLQPYGRQPHITLAVCGFAAAMKIHNDDINFSEIDAQINILQTMQLPSFPLLVGGLNSFASAPFLEVGDINNSLDQLRDALVGDKEQFHTAHYVPHITVGIYNDKHDMASILRCASMHEEETIEIMVNAIGLYSYVACDIGSSLQLEKSIYLV